jgi:hypothetical protein
MLNLLEYLILLYYVALFSLGFTLSLKKPVVEATFLVITHCLSIKDSYVMLFKIVNIQDVTHTFLSASAFFLFHIFIFYILYIFQHNQKPKQ